MSDEEQDRVFSDKVASDITRESLEELRRQFIHEFNNPLGLPGNNHRKAIRLVRKDD